MQIASWNINSVRLRKHLVEKFLIEQNVDVLCLQETKTEDKTFPEKYFQDLGYEGIYYSGQKSYNGVAIISKKPLSNIQIFDFCNDHKRHISADIETQAGTVTLHNFYIPAGGDIADVDENPKFAHKMDYLREMQVYFSDSQKSSKAIIVGDFNIAPLEHDVWSHKQLLKVVSHTPIEVENLDLLKSKGKFTDVAREFISADEKLYSWWSYRGKDWRKSNRGRRLDHIWVGESLKDKVKKYSDFSDFRDAEKPSDHIPIMAKFDF